jgi:hypothetical protein
MRRPGDDTPDPPGGRAAERLRHFENARRPVSKGEAESSATKIIQGPKTTRSGKKKKKKRSPAHEEQAGRKK